MVCPLRFVLLSVSVLVAALAMYFCRDAAPGLFDECNAADGSSDSARRRGGIAEQHTPPSPRQRLGDAAAFVRDCMTGRYLYTQYTRWSQAVAKANSVHKGK